MHTLGCFQRDSSLCPLSIVTASDTFLAVYHVVMRFCCQRKLKETQYFSSERQKEYWSISGSDWRQYRSEPKKGPWQRNYNQTFQHSFKPTINTRHIRHRPVPQTAEVPQASLRHCSIYTSVTVTLTATPTPTPSHPKIPSQHCLAKSSPTCHTWHPQSSA